MAVGGHRSFNLGLIWLSAPLREDYAPGTLCRVAYGIFTQIRALIPRTEPFQFHSNHVCVNCSFVGTETLFIRIIIKILQGLRSTHTYPFSSVIFLQYQWETKAAQCRMLWFTDIVRVRTCNFFFLNRKGIKIVFFKKNYTYTDTKLCKNSSLYLNSYSMFVSYI